MLERYLRHRGSRNERRHGHCPEIRQLRDSSRMSAALRGIATIPIVGRGASRPGAARSPRRQGSRRLGRDAGNESSRPVAAIADACLHANAAVAVNRPSARLRLEAEARGAAYVPRSGLPKCGYG
jgi:hypothetical protein